MRIGIGIGDIDDNGADEDGGEGAYAAVTLDGGVSAWLARVDADAALWEPERLRARMDALDELDALLADSRAIRAESMFARAVALRERLEAASGAVYAAIRDEVRRGVGTELLRQWISHCEDDGAARRGLGYDHLDELIAGVLGLREPASESVLEPEMVLLSAHAGAAHSGDDPGERARRKRCARRSRVGIGACADAGVHPDRREGNWD